MVFDYTVKHNGVRYPAGTDVPVGVAEPKVEVKKEPEKVVETPQPKKVEVDKPLPKTKAKKTSRK